jgi:methyl-accepting chemotaxis protein
MAGHREISEMSQSISAATEEQTTNAKQVSKAIENVNELTQQAASAAEEMTYRKLSTLAHTLRR